MEKTQDYRGKGALDAFLNLLNLITLGWISIAIGGLWFKIIDKFFNADYFTESSQIAIKSGFAVILIVTPIFLGVAGSLHRHYKNKTLDPASGIYRWLTYLMLLIASLVIAGSLVTIVFKFLDGEYTIASILKVLTLLIISGGIFGYYWYDLKRSDYNQKSKVSIIAASILIVVAIIGLIFSVFIIDSPETTRMKRNDEQRVSDLTSLNALITSYYLENNELPADLTVPRFSTFKDPSTDQPYGYNKLAEDKYELCSDFSLPAEENGLKFIGGSDWNYHGVGYQCFPVTINPDIMEILQSQLKNQIEQISAQQVR